MKKFECCRLVRTTRGGENHLNVVGALHESSHESSEKPGMVEAIRESPHGPCLLSATTTAATRRASPMVRTTGSAVRATPVVCATGSAVCASPMVRANWGTVGTVVSQIMSIVWASTIKLGIASVQVIVSVIIGAVVTPIVVGVEISV